MITAFTISPRIWPPWVEGIKYVQLRYNMYRVEIDFHSLVDSAPKRYFSPSFFLREYAIEHAQHWINHQIKLRAAVAAQAQ